MGIPQVETFSKIGLSVSSPHSEACHTEPPEIPPRMKKKGPELPEKPAHLRLAALTKTSKSISNSLASPPQVSSQNHHVGQVDNRHHTKTTEVKSVPYSKDRPTNDQKLFLDVVRKKTASSHREILVAATKGARDRPAEKRQREPAKLLTPISSSHKEDDSIVENDSLPILLGLSSPKPRRKNNPPMPNNSVCKLESYKPLIGIGNNSHKFGKPRAPVILIPRSQLDTRSLHQIWNSYPVSYSVWVQNAGSGDPQVSSRLLRRSLSPTSGGLRQIQDKHGKGGIVKSKEFPLEAKIFVNGKNPSSSLTPASGASAKPRSSSVTRSGSLTSHGSTSSDSGNETFPKSVLKKHKRDSCSNSSGNSKKTNEHKKNVTFNAFATVQLMEE